MRSTPTLVLSAGLLLSSAYANRLAQEVFDAIDKRDEGLRNVNKEVSISFEICPRFNA